MKIVITLSLLTLLSCKKNPFDPNEPSDGMDSTKHKSNEQIIRDTLHRTNSGTFGK